MATGSQRGHAPVQSVSYFPDAAMVQVAVPGPAGALERLKPHSRFCDVALMIRTNMWERTFPGTEDQLAYVRTALRPLLRDCLMADDVLLVMHELAANAVRHSRSGEDGGTFTVRLITVPGQYVLGEVEDGGSDWDGDLRGSAREASGLFLVLNLAAACGVSAGRWKRVVWFRMHYPYRRLPAILGATVRPTPG